ncbi:hypothetical protein LPJ73_007260, partial [Coemansia sp. RSA 2703]
VIFILGQMSAGDSRHNAPPSSSNKNSSYARIQPRGDPDEHRQAMAEEMELQNSHLISERRRRNTQAAARMRERQKERERSLLQHRDELVAKMKKLEAELASARSQREQHEGKYTA